MTLDLPAVPARPMGGEPITYPLTPLSALSDDARVMHRWGVRKQRLDRDVFAPKAEHMYVTREDADAFEPTPRMLDAIAELEAGRLADYRPEYNSLYTTAVHPDYTVAYGRGSQLIQVRVFNETPDEAKLLAVLVGGDLDTREGRRGMPELVVESRHENATDFEHDTTKTALLTIRNAGPAEFMGNGGVKITGVLTEALLHPIGTDVLTVDDGDTRPGETCTRCENPHPFAAFQPPQLDLGGPRFAIIQATPIRPYLLAAENA